MNSSPLNVQHLQRLQQAIQREVLHFRHQSQNAKTLLRQVESQLVTRSLTQNNLQGLNELIQILKTLIRQKRSIASELNRMPDSIQQRSILSGSHNHELSRLKYTLVWLQSDCEKLIASIKTKILVFIEDPSYQLLAQLVQAKADSPLNKIIKDLGLNEGSAQLSLQPQGATQVSYSYSFSDPKLNFTEGETAMVQNAHTHQQMLVPSGPVKKPVTPKYPMAYMVNESVFFACVIALLAARFIEHKKKNK